MRSFLDERGRHLMCSFQARLYYLFIFYLSIIVFIITPLLLDERGRNPPLVLSCYYHLSILITALTAIYTTTAAISVRSFLHEPG